MAIPACALIAPAAIAEGAVVVMVSVEVTLEPEGVTEMGENVQLAFDGAPLQVSDTAELNPFAGVRVIVYVALCPALTEAVVGKADRLKSGAAVTVIVVFAVWVLVPSVALTEMVLLPAVSALAETVSVLELPGVTLAGEKLHPLAGCMHWKLRLAASPLTAVVAMAMVALAPAAMVELAGVSVIVKLGTAAVTVTVALAVWVWLPSLALTVMVSLPTANALAATISVLEPPGLTVAGEKLQPLAGAVHDRLMDAASPLMAEVSIVKVAFEPAMTLCVAGEAVTLKSVTGAVFDGITRT